MLTEGSNYTENGASDGKQSCRHKTWENKYCHQKDKFATMNKMSLVQYLSKTNGNRCFQGVIGIYWMWSGGQRLIDLVNTDLNTKKRENYNVEM